MKDISGKGYIAGFITWIVIMIFTVTQASCLKTESCGGIDLLLFAIIGLGMLGPAWLVANFVSSELDK